MKDGIQITDGVDIQRAKPTDFTINSEEAGGMKINTTVTFKNGGTLTLMGSGISAYIQKYSHNLGYVPAYIAFRGTNSAGGQVNMPFNNFISVAGASDFVNVDLNYINVGFDEFDGADFIKVIIFEEKISNS